MSKVRHVPSLRFPEFLDKGEWVETKLGLIGAFTGGGTPSKDQASYWIGTNPWISSSDISDDNIQDISISRFISDQAIKKTATKLVPKNSILLVSRVGVGKLAITRKPICTSQDFTNFTPANDNLVFLAYCLKSLKDTFLAFNQGMAIKGFTKDDASNLSITLPTLGEQQKIADCLASLDELITLEAQKLDTLKTHKKGLMQQLFPAEGETLPKLRFPEFREAGEWDEKTLSHLGELISGLTYSPDDVRDEGLLVLRSSNVQNGMIVFDNNVYVRVDIKGPNPSKPNDILICVRNGSKSLIGKNALIPDGIPLCTHGAFMTVFRSDSARFIIQLFQTEAYEKQVAADLGATINSINGNQLKKYKFFVPEPAEQLHIADCLASLDALIAAQTQKLAALKIQKKGLMQQLFPTLDEGQG
jgi:type I restriction enzyme S subunit